MEAVDRRTDDTALRGHAFVGEAPSSLHLKICDFDGPLSRGQHSYVYEGISHDDGNGQVVQ